MSYSFKRLSPDARVLVTGATGFIGSATTVTLLERGYKVRAVTRSLSKAQQFRQQLEEKYGKDRVDFVAVDDYGKLDSWNGVLEGIEGVLHLATDGSFTADYDAIVNNVKDATLTLLKAASKAPSVRSFVLTSSRVAVFVPQLGQDVNVTVNDWADYFIELGKNLKPDDPNGAGIVYSASKVVGEHEAYNFVKTEKPNFAFNTILPDYVAGPVFNPTPGAYSTHSWLNEVFRGSKNNLAVAFMNPTSLLVDVRDVAATHVAALTESNTNGQRIWAATHTYTIDDILAAWREAFPTREILPDFKFTGQPVIKIDGEASEALLRAFKGTGPYTLKETVVANVHDAL